KRVSRISNIEAGLLCVKSFQPHRTGDLSFTPSKLSAPLIRHSGEETDGLRLVGFFSGGT
ncbi:hypothetical protein, partial [Deinococcus wulumuqiensis]